MLRALILAAILLGPEGPIENPSPEMQAMLAESERTHTEARENWRRELEALAATHEGTRHLQRALASVQDIVPDVNLWFDMDRVSAHGFSGVNEHLLPVLDAHTAAIESAAAAASCESIPLPPFHDSIEIPHFPEEWDTLTSLLGANAQRLLAEGHPDAAAERALQMMVLASKVPFEGRDFYGRLLWSRGLTRARPALESAVRHPEISDEMLERIDATLETVIRDWPSFGVTFRWGLEESIEEMRQLAADPEMRTAKLAEFAPETIRAQMDQMERMRETYSLGDALPDDWYHLDHYLAQARTQRRGYEQALADVDRFAEETQRYIEALEGNLGRPPWQREYVDQAWTAQFTDMIHWTGDEESGAALELNANHFPMNEDLILARLSLMRVLCRLRLGDDDRVSEVIDIFTGEPLRFDDEQIWSLGPDQIDQYGEVEVEMITPNLFNPRIPEGDVVLMR